MKNKHIIAFFALLLTLCLTACSGGDVQNNMDTNMNSNISDFVSKSLPATDQSASFADNLILLTADDGNRMLSPYSAKMCLALLANGAEGETRQQILDAIGIEDLDVYNADVKALLARYASYEKVMTLSTANSLWLNQTTLGGKGAFIESYRDAMQDCFSAEIREVTDKNSIEEVNAWVNEKTNGKIDQILTEDHRSFAAALLNAVYFKAAWEFPFSENLTEQGNFTNADGSISETEFMHDTGTYGYYQADGIQAVKLNYNHYADEYTYFGDGYDFSMYLILSEDMPQIEALLNTVEFKSEKVCLTIPKFEMHYSVSMNEILRKLGITDAFDRDKADLGAMVDLTATANNLFVDEVLQKTYIKIDENGTEAAAVTEILVAPTSAAIEIPRPIKEFTADKPFYFVVRDNTSGELLFVGRYETVK